MLLRILGSDDLSHNLIDKYEVVPSQGEWLTSLAQLINSMVSPLNQADIVRKDRKDLNKESAEMSPQTLSKRMALDTDHIIISNDSNWYEKSIEFYPFEGIELLEDEQRQRRRLRSASDGFHLINANVEHISTMINSVFSSSRDYISNETVRSSVVRYLTTKMRSFGLVVGNQLFDPREFMELVGVFFACIYCAISYLILNTVNTKSCSFTLSFTTIQFQSAQISLEYCQANYGTRRMMRS